MSDKRTESEARNRAEWSWEDRYKHGKAARTWEAVSREQPARREVCEILARQMSAYADADAVAEREFRELAARIATAPAIERG